MDLTGRRIGTIHIEGSIGRGGMGDVYRGFDEKLHRVVAIKALRDEHGMKPEARARFVREARILSRLNHPGICQIYDLVSHPDADLLILEYIDGRTLRQLDADGLGSTAKLRIALAVVEALATAHREGIVHRDLKPDNIMVTTQRQVKVLDFSIARFTESPDSEAPWDEAEEAEAYVELAAPASGTTATRFARPGGTYGDVEDPPTTGTSPESEATFYTLNRKTLGTLAYMSPEQARNKPVTPASDMYSFGLVLHELFTGQKAYPDKPVGALALKVHRGETQPVDGVDSDLAALIEDLKEPRPANRPTAAQARGRLLEILDRPARQRRKRRRLWLAAAALVLVAAASGAIAFSRLQNRNQSAAAQRFVQEAKDVEWLMRTTYLSPPAGPRQAGLSSTREQVRGRMDRLQERMRELGRIGRGPGEYALGRAALALGDYEAARRHLERAWAAPYQLPDVAAALGLALAELYQRERSRIDMTVDPERRQRRLAVLETELRDPALEFLGLSRQRQISTVRRDGGEGVVRLDSIDYAEALIAFIEERYDEAMESAERAARKLSGFYEGRALAARIYQARAERAFMQGAYDDAEADFRGAREAYLEAASIGRSDPALYLGLCSLGEAQMLFSLYGPGGDARPVFEEGVAACETVLEIDPDNASAYRLLADLYSRMGEYDEGDPEPMLAKAAEMAYEALARQSEDASTQRVLGHIQMIRADWGITHGQDPRPAASRALAAYQEAHRLAPADGRIVNSIGNVHSIFAEAAAERSEDPRASVRAAVAAYERAAILDPSLTFTYPNSALVYHTLAVFELAQGLDPRPTVAKARQVIAKGLAANPNDVMTHRELADVGVVEARYEILQGRDPASLLKEAVVAGRRAVEIVDDDPYAWLSLAAAWQTRADYELQRGGEPETELAEALAAARRSVEVYPTFVDGLDAIASACRGQAELARRHGRDPSVAVDCAEGAL